VDVDVDGTGQQQRLAIVGPGTGIGRTDRCDAAVGDRQAGTPAGARRSEDRAGDLLDQ
jgi:hypothetical protein